jgi:hypothetical protein
MDRKKGIECRCQYVLKKKIPKIYKIELKVPGIQKTSHIKHVAHKTARSNNICSLFSFVLHIVSVSFILLPLSAYIFLERNTKGVFHDISNDVEEKEERF